ncbi:MAG: FtsX-like permease family protein [Nitrospinota bacterium]|nr:FtsX-like permease family protein [Nitrospinota bacterium]
MGFFSLAKMAWRNLWRNTRRTLITLSSIALAVMFSILGAGMNDRVWKDVIDVAARMGGGHVTIQHPEYADKPTLTRTVMDVEKRAAQALKNDNVSRVVPRIVGQTLLSTAYDSFGAGFIAYDPQIEDNDTLSILEAVKTGEAFSSPDQRGILLGATLARNLGARIGKKVVYTMTNKNGEIVHGLARVTGIIKSGSPSVDLGLCLLPIGAVRKELGYARNEATQVALFLRDNRHSDLVARQLGAQLGGKYEALNWQKSQPDLDSMIAMKKGGMVFFELLILTLCAAGIFNTVFVSVMERMREFGVMMAIGFSPWRLFTLVMLESFWLAMVGLVAGAMITIWPYRYLNTTGMDLSEIYGGEKVELAGIGMSSVLKVEIYPESAWSIAVVVVIATLLSGLYPAWRAGRLNPVDAIKLV